jgi:Putative addiction module component
MTSAVEKLLAEATKLSPIERHELAELLLAELPLQSAEPDASFDAAWGQEAERRWQEHMSSGELTVDAFDAVETARKSLRTGQ